MNPQPMNPIHRTWRMLSSALLAGVLLTGSTGCMSFSLWGRKPAALTQTEPPLPATATAEEVLARVNKNCYSEYSPDGLKRYRCDDMRVTMHGVPAPMKASMVVEAPRNLRIRVNNPLTGGEGLDVGSNGENFWYWQKGAQPDNVLVCNHDHIAYATQIMSLPLPFRPDWLMEVLGVEPISGSDYEIRRTNQNSPIVELVSVQRTPDQQAVRRIAKVNTRVGVVLEHRVESIEGQMIARATLKRHFRDPSTRLVLPREIQIEWPAAGQQLSLSMVLNSVEFNSAPEATAMWQPPPIPGSPPLDLGRMAMQQLGINATEVAKTSKSRDIPRKSGSATLDDMESEPPTDQDPAAPSTEPAEQWAEAEDPLETIERPIRQTAEAVTEDAPGGTFSQPAFEPADTIPLSEESVPPETSDEDPRPFPD